MAAPAGEQKEVERKRERKEETRKRRRKMEGGMAWRDPGWKEGANDELAPIRQKERGGRRPCLRYKRVKETSFGLEAFQRRSGGNPYASSELDGGIPEWQKMSLGGGREPSCGGGACD